MGSRDGSGELPPEALVAESLEDMFNEDGLQISAACLSIRHETNVLRASWRSRPTCSEPVSEARLQRSGAELFICVKVGCSSCRDGLASDHDEVGEGDHAAIVFVDSLKTRIGEAFCQALIVRIVEVDAAV